MIRILVAFIAFSYIFTLVDVSPAEAQSRLQTISKGASGGKKGDGEEGGSGGGGGERLGSGPAGLHDIVFLGVFENYLPTKRYNARLTVFAEPRKFLLGHRACTKVRKIRDEINGYFFREDLKVDRKGRVDTKGMDVGVRKAIKKALKTKLEYFTSVYVYSGRYNTNKLPKELKDQGVTDCSGVIDRKKEMDKAEK